MLDISRLSLLSPIRLSDDTVIEADSASIGGESVECDVFKALRLRKSTPSEVLLDPKHHDDFLWTWYHDVFVRDHVAAALRDSGLNGFELLPTIVMSGSPDRGLPRLWELRVTGFAGFASSKMKVEKMQYCERHRAATYKLDGSFFEMIDPMKWDGSDLFTVWPFPLLYIASEKFMDFYRKMHFTGVEFEPVLERLHLGQASPGLPEQWFSPNNVDRLNNDPEFKAALQRDRCRRRAD